MSVLGNNLLAAYWAQQNSGYIKDGLVCWLDGINNTRHGHDANVSCWEDLSGNGYDFVPAANGYMPTIQENGYSGFNTKSYLVCHDNTLKNYRLSHTQGTLEIIASLNNNTACFLFGFTQQDNYEACKCFSFSTAERAVCVSSAFSSTANSLFKITEISNIFQKESFAIQYAPQDNVPCNAFVASKLTTVDYSNLNFINYGNGETAIIGIRNHPTSPSLPWYGTIYSLRYYDRIITQSEILNNYLIDKRRFNLS